MMPMSEKVAPSTPLLRRNLVAFRVPQVPHRFNDILILGSGVAGLSAALAASEDPGTEVLLVAKDNLKETATFYAQGGVAAVLSPEKTGDSVEKHVADTLAAADGLSDEDVAGTELPHEAR